MIHPTSHLSCKAETRRSHACASTHAGPPRPTPVPRAPGVTRSVGRLSLPGAATTPPSAADGSARQGRARPAGRATGRPSCLRRSKVGRAAVEPARSTAPPRGRVHQQLQPDLAPRGPRRRCVSDVRRQRRGRRRRPRAQPDVDGQRCRSPVQPRASTGRPRVEVVVELGEPTVVQNTPTAAPWTPQLVERSAQSRRRDHALLRLAPDHSSTRRCSTDVHSPRSTSRGRPLPEARASRTPRRDHRKKRPAPRSGGDLARRP